MARESGTQSSTQTAGRDPTPKPGQSTDKGKATETQSDDNKPINRPDRSPGGDPNDPRHSLDLQYWHHTREAKIKAACDSLPDSPF